MEGRVSVRASVTGAWLATAAMAMFFSALFSALVIRRGLGEDWGSGVALPQAVWVSTGLVLISSVLAACDRWRLAALASVGFLSSQMAAWSLMGFALSSGPAVAFFYLLTMAHAAHVAGGIVALGLRAARPAVRVYWHSLTVLWMVILCLLLWRF